ncbi:MAG: type II secretion system secretin GspD [Stellaceae bacterium]
MTMRRGQRLPAVCAAAMFLLLGACHQPETGLLPLEQPTGLQAAAPRISGPIPSNRIEKRAFEDRRQPVVPASARGGSPPPPGVAISQGGDVTLNFVDTDIREIVRAVLGTTLKVAYTIDPAVHGTGSIETPTPLPRSALIGTLETLLNGNGAALVVRDGIYNVVPVPAGAIGNLASGANAIGAGAEVVPLRYAAARDLAKMLEPYIGQGGKITADPAANAVLVSGDAAIRQTLIGLIHAFDIDILSGRSYALFPVGDGDPAKLAAELGKVMQAQGEGSLSGIVQVLPMERVNAVLVVSAQPRYLDAADRFFHLAQRAEEATSRTWHVYYVQNGQSADLEALLQRAFTPGNVSPTPPPPGSTAPGATPAALGFGNASGGATGVGGAVGGISSTGTASTTGTTGTGTTGGGGLGSALAATGTTTAAATETPATEPLSTETGQGAGTNLNRMRIIANRTNNALLIYATPDEYSVVEGMLHKIDVVPLQVLIEATIAEVDLNDQLQYGTQFFFKTDHVAETLGTPTVPNFPSLTNLTFPSSSPYFILSKMPNFALSALAQITTVKILSAPEIMVLDNQPARLQVGQQVPVLTGQATSTLAAGAPVVNSVDYHETGVIMQVTPRVNTGGLVSLDIGQEVSSVAQAATNTVNGSPTFNDQVFRTRVVVQDGQTVGMAGLITDNVARGNSGLPFLKDIPLLGTLFSTQSNARMRAELLVLITPHVVRDQRDARALTEDLRNQLINAGLVPQQAQHTRSTGSANPNGL